MIVKAVLDDIFTITKEVYATNEYYWKREITNEIISLCEIKTKYNEKPRSAKVKFYQSVVINNEITWKYLFTVDTYYERLKITQLEYDDLEYEILEGIPVCFADWIRGKAYDEGHSGGLEDVLSYVKEYTSSLRPVIEEYKNQIQKE